MNPDQGAGVSPLARSSAFAERRLSAVRYYPCMSSHQREHAKDGESARRIIAPLVGATAGLENAQIFKVHIFVLAVVFFAITSRNKRFRFQAVLLAASVGAFVSTALYGHYVNSKVTAIQLALLALSAILISLTATARDLKLILLGLLGATSLGAILAIGQYVHLLPLTLFHGEARPSGIIYSEPDFLGLYCAVGTLVALRSGLAARRLYPLVAVNLTAVALSLARAAWVGLAAALLISLVTVLLLRSQRRSNGRYLRAVAAFVIIGTLVVIASPSLRNRIDERIRTANSTATSASASGGSVSAAARRQQDASLRRLADISPWYGAGITASGRVGIFGGIQTSGHAPNNIGSNWVLSWWAEGKWIALPLIALFIGSALRRCTSTAGLVLCLILVNDLYSNTMLLPISWAVLGLCLWSEKSAQGRHVSRHIASADAVLTRSQASRERAARGRSQAVRA